MPIHRRCLLALLGSGIAAPALAQAPAMSRQTAYSFNFATLDGGKLALGEHTGKPILVVNTASQCGYTPQLAGLQKLWALYRDRGLLIVGVPSNDFGGQEPGGPVEINKTAHDEYGVSFPLAAKAGVKGPTAHPFYKWAALERPGEGPRWNFHKYLIGRDGRIAAVFATQVEPTDTRVIAAIEKELL
ncbi:MAG: glutathione peroxidase [Alphaproteobacteria bacterium]|nr:glutathione peroxidase [Alphaproteobacteria bacterium]